MSDPITVVQQDVDRVVAVEQRTIVAVSAPGPQGPRGIQGIQGPPGDPDALGYTYTTSSPAYLHQVQHGLPFKPAGVTCLDTDGAQVEYSDITHPAPGVTEVTFGVLIAPTIHLS